MAAEKNAAGDIVLWIIAISILGAGIYGFAHFEGQLMLLFRVIGLVVMAGVAFVVAARTVKGREFVGYVRETDVERRKVVWPSRQETFQTTLIVLVITIIAAIILAIMDFIFGGSVRWLIGSGGGT